MKTDFKTCKLIAKKYLEDEPGDREVWDWEHNRFRKGLDKKEFMRLKMISLDRCRYISDLVDQLRFEDQLFFLIDIRYFVAEHILVELVLCELIDKRELDRDLPKEKYSEFVDMMKILKPYLEDYNGRDPQGEIEVCRSGDSDGLVWYKNCPTKQFIRRVNRKDILLNLGNEVILEPERK